MIAPLLALVGAAYLGLTLSYTLLWRHVLVLDIVAIAGGFVLRAVAGGVAAPVTLSRWFVLVVVCGAVFVAAGKRYAELAASWPRPPRPTPGAELLQSARLLELILAASAAVALVAYCVWAFELPAVRGIPWRPLTIAPVRRLSAPLRCARPSRSRVRPPRTSCSRDRPLQLAGLAWLVLFALEVHAAS